MKKLCFFRHVSGSDSSKYGWGWCSSLESRETLMIFLKGMFMGIADIIPGVSGGTIALITGIYDRLIHAISDIDLKFIPYLLEGEFGAAKKNILRIDFKLFIPLLSGIGLAFLIMSNIIHFLLHNVTAPTYAFFFGLILTSAVFVYRDVCGASLRNSMKAEAFRHVDKISSKNLLFFIIGFLFAFLFVGSGALQIGHSIPIIFLSGMVAICAMILPGISGAFMLLFLNQYEYMLSALRSLQFMEIFTFCFGALISILLFSRFLGYILERYRSFTMFFLIGLMLGALRLPYIKIVGSMNSFLPVLASAIFGFLIIFAVEIIAAKLSKGA